MKVGRIFGIARMAGSPAATVAFVAATALLVATATGCASSGRANGQGSPSPAPAETPAPGGGLLLNFDQQAGQGQQAQQPQVAQVRDASGNGFDGKVIAENGGQVRWVAGKGGTGRAARFPDLCREAGCTQPTAVIRISAARRLNAGPAPFGFGASVNLSELSDGANVMQKGHFTDRVQWKLQVDNGQPSCVLHTGKRRAVVVAPQRLSTGQWYNLECRKNDASIAILVNGAESARKDVRLGSIQNNAPVHIGAKGPGAVNNDQFHGMLDNVFVRVAN